MIRKTIENDLETIVEIQIALRLDGWSILDYRNELGRSDSMLLTGVSDSKVVGFIAARLIKADASIEIYNIGVGENQQRGGIGTMLLQGIIANAAPGIRNIWLEVRKSNGAAIAFYQKHGFIIHGERKNFYKNPTEDALLMQRELLKEMLIET